VLAVLLTSLLAYYRNRIDAARGEVIKHTPMTKGARPRQFRNETGATADLLRH